MHDPAADPETTALDYVRIARAIEWLQAQAAAQPDLASAARHVGLSEFHFQRLFTRWAGVSPKRFLQFLTVEDAKRRLQGTRNTLDLAAAVGLSGSGRLHDLFVTLDAMSPGEARLGGAGLDIRYGVHDTRFGPALIATTTRGVCALHFVNAESAGLEQLRQAWPHAQHLHDPAATAAIAQRLFTPLAAETQQPLALLVKGTNFQIQVWRALLALPAGALTTYGELAESLDKPDAARAVGAAVGANSIAWLIPCHRVIRASGVLTGYRWGTPRKAAMLSWEAAQSIQR
ncbi:MAG: methylated-DNA--[protein]-cysteine S-methyltransferase [Burkholderiales bacterium]|nr:methylated-DNA--[protein]-cysteine S-methyltransferase [Burkholderiales bacterium]